MNKSMSVSELLLDETLYPRHKVSAYNVNRIMEALQAGATMPPIVVDEKTHKVIDGYHRITAARRMYGENATIDVELRKYKNEREMFRDAVRLNSAHGVNLGKQDRTRCLVFAKNLGIELEVIIVDLNLTLETAQEMLEERTATDVSGQTIALKGSTTDLAGTQLTKEQAEFNADRASGMKLTFHINQVIGQLETKSTKLTEKVMERLGLLYERLQEVLT